MESEAFREDALLGVSERKVDGTDEADGVNEERSTSRALGDRLANPRAEQGRSQAAEAHGQRARDDPRRMRCARRRSDGRDAARRRLG
jgi:hypothetical protein